MNLKQRLQSISNEIIDTKNNFSRLSEDIKLLAVSKTRPAKNIRALYELGQKSFGESYLQEALIKQTELQDCKIEWHFIGPIQSNKTHLISQHFDWVQSLCREKIAKRLNDASINKINPLNVLIQINLNNETTKEGIPPCELHHFCNYLKSLKHLKPRGLMAIPQKTNNPQIQKANFQELLKLYKSYQKEFNFDTLSMGMSNDYKVAIENGSTLVRIGTKLFGERL